MKLAKIADKEGLSSHTNAHSPLDDNLSPRASVIGKIHPVLSETKVVTGVNRKQGQASKEGALIRQVG